MDAAIAKQKPTKIPRDAGVVNKTMDGLTSTLIGTPAGMQPKQNAGLKEDKALTRRKVKETRSREQECPPVKVVKDKTSKGVQTRRSMKMVHNIVMELLEAVVEDAAPRGSREKLHDIIMGPVSSALGDDAAIKKRHQKRRSRKAKRKRKAMMRKSRRKRKQAAAKRRRRLREAAESKRANAVPVENIGPDFSCPMGMKTMKNPSKFQRDKEEEEAWNELLDMVTELKVEQIVKRRPKRTLRKKVSYQIL